jgi:hypothetical protein
VMARPISKPVYRYRNLSFLGYFGMPRIAPHYWILVHILGIKKENTIRNSECKRNRLCDVETCSKRRKGRGIPALAMQDPVVCAPPLVKLKRCHRPSPPIASTKFTPARVSLCPATSSALMQRSLPDTADEISGDCLTSSSITPNRSRLVPTHDPNPVPLTMPCRCLV